jgi:hypothetical protein
MDAAVAAIAEGKTGIHLGCKDDKEAKSLVLRLHKFRQAYEAQALDETTKHAYAGLKITSTTFDQGHEQPGVSIVVASGNTWKIKVLE